MSFAEACGAADATRAAACEAVARRMRDEGIDLVRIGWCDTHGILRGKTLTAAAVPRVLASGIGMASTILLKDTSDRTALPRVRARRHRRLAGLRQRLQPACSCPTRRAFACCRGRRAPAGCAPRPGSTMRRRCRSTPAASSAARSAPGRSGLRPHLRPRGRVPHLSPRRCAPRCGLARSRARRLAGRAAGDDDDPSRLQPARRGLGRSRRRALAHRPAHRRGPGPAARLARDRARPEPGRGGVRRHRCAHRGRPHGRVPQRRDARRCAAPAITPASSAGRRSRT